jgi:adenylate cyclase
MARPRPSSIQRQRVSVSRPSCCLPTRLGCTESIEAQSQLANSLMSRVLDGMTDSAAADLTRAEKLVDQALAASPRYALAHFVKGDVLRARGKCEEAISEYETALSLNRNLVVALAAIGRCKIYVGPIDEGIAAQEQAIRLSPRDPFLWSWYFRIGEGHLLLSRVDDAILWLEKARNANPTPSYIHAYLASAYAIRGETERAAAEVGEARKLAREGSYSSIAKMKAGRPSSQSDTIRALFDATYFVGLRKAGVPEE